MKDSMNLIEQFHKFNSDGVDAEGIKIIHAIARCGEKHHMLAMALTGLDSGKETYVHFARFLVRERPDELIFGLDRWVKTGQGMDDVSDALSVHYWNGTVWRFGVIAYRFDPPLFGAIDWDNPHWCGPHGILAQEMASQWSYIKNAPHRDPSPAMQLPLKVFGCRPTSDTPQTTDVHS